MSGPDSAFEEALASLAGELLGERLTLQDVHRRVLERAVQVVPHAEAGAVLVRGPDGRYRYSATCGYDAGALDGLSFTGDELLHDPESRSAVYTDVLSHLCAALDPCRFERLRRGWRQTPWRSTLAVPLSPGAHPAALLYLHSGRAPGDLTHSVRLAELFGAQVALAVQHAALGEAVERAERELTLLGRARDVIARSGTQGELFGGLVEVVREVLGYEHVQVALLDGDELVVQPGPGHSGGGRLGVGRFPLGQGVTGWVARTGEARLVADVRAEADYVPLSPGVVSELCVPLSSGATAVGILNVETEGRALTGDDLRLMTMLSEWLGRALEREQLYAEAARQRRELEVLHRVRTALGRELEVSGVIRAVDEALAQLLGYTHVSVYLRRGDTLELQHQIGYPQVIERLGLGSGVMGRVARTGEAVWLPDLTRDPEAVTAFDGITSEVCVPLRRGSEVVGVLNVETVGDHHLTRDDWRLIETVGEYVNLALDRALLHAQVREQGALYRLLAEHTSDLVCLHHPDGTFAYVSPSVGPLLGLDPASLVGTRPHDLVHPDDHAALRGLSARTRLPAGEAPPLRLRLRRADGGDVWFETGISVVPGPQGAQFLTSSRDVTQRQAVEAELAWAATHDALTGLPNRAELLTALERAVTLTRELGKATYTVLYLDMDRFKVVNDSLGHGVGDELLQAFARRLRGAVPARGVVARLGGDEFAVLFTGPASFEEAQDAAARLRGAMNAPFPVSGHALRMSVSVGLAPGRVEYACAAEVLRDADLSMYRAKRTRHRTSASYAVFDPAMHDHAVRQLRLEADLPGALASGALHLDYQPIVCLASGEPRGFEALARWTHPTLGAVPPGEFIPLAEELGLIVDLGRWALREACLWRAALPGPGCTVQVNVSPRQFLLDSFADDVREVLEATGTPAEALHLEVTESTFVEDREGAARILGRLRRLGVRVSLDDFGTGHSSLGFLHEFPVDALKIDRSFVARLGEDRVSAGVVQTVLSLAHTLGIETVAEGIETGAQREHLRELGATLGQGYLFSRPLAAEAARQMWAAACGQFPPGSPGSGARPGTPNVP